MLTKAQAVEQLRQERKGPEQGSTRNEMAERLERLNRLHTEGHPTESERPAAEAHLLQA
jgi:hypothetical protein